jgi:hypothetical protein
MSNMEIIDVPTPDPSEETSLRWRLASVCGYTLAILDDCRSPSLQAGTAILIRIGDRLFAATAAHCIGPAPYLAFDQEFPLPTDPTPARYIARHPMLDIGLIEVDSSRTGRSCGLETLDVTPPVLPADPRRPERPGYWIVGYPRAEDSRTRDALILTAVSVGTHPVEVADVRYTFTYPVRFVRLVDGEPVSGTSPESPVGFSGGGIWRFADDPSDGLLIPSSFVRLTAIQSAWQSSIRHAYCVPIRHWIELVYDHYADLRSLLVSHFSFLAER